jgi:hypothetical protein
MRWLVIVVLVLASHTSYCKADLVLTLEQVETGSIVAGQPAQFNVYIRANEATGSISNFGGIDFFAHADDPLGDTTRIAGGSFLTGTSPLFATPFQIPFPTSFQYFIGNSGGVGVTVETTNTLLATLTLGTTGATEGNYIMGLSDVFAADTSFNNIAISNASTTSIGYSITTVPEPSSGLLCGLSLLTYIAAHRFRKNRIYNGCPT